MAATSSPLPTTAAHGADRAATLRKELGFADLVFASILMVVIPDFFGTAVKAGPAHVLLKWLTNIGSALTVVVIAFLAALPFYALYRGALADYHPLRVAVPPLTLFGLSVFSKMTFGALCGFEYTAIFAGEARNPRQLTRAIFLATPIIALLYIFGTSAILRFVSPDKIDVIGPVPQALEVALGGSRLAELLVPLAILCLLTNYLASFAMAFTANTRLPLCAGWDHLLPGWFTRLHPRFRTPVNSILFLGAITLTVSAAVLIGVGSQEAFAMLQIWGFTFYGIAYLVLFAVPVAATKNRSLRGPLWLRVLAVSGFLLTLFFVALSVFPIIPVVSETAYTEKAVAVLLLANVAGLLLYRLRPCRSIGSGGRYHGASRNLPSLFGVLH